VIFRVRRLGAWIIAGTGTPWCLVNLPSQLTCVRHKIAYLLTYLLIVAGEIYEHQEGCILDSLGHLFFLSLLRFDSISVQYRKDRRLYAHISLFDKFW